MPSASRFRCAPLATVCMSCHVLSFVPLPHATTRALWVSIGYLIQYWSWRQAEARAKAAEAKATFWRIVVVFLAAAITLLLVITF